METGFKMLINNLGTADITVIIFTLTYALLTMMYYCYSNKKSKPTRENILDEKNQLIPVTLSITATHLTSINIVGFPADAYSFGVHLLITYISSLLLYPLITDLYFSVFFKLGLQSPNQFIIFFGVFLLILITAQINSKGMLSILDTSNKQGRLDIFKFNPDPTIRYTFWNTVIGGVLGELSVTVVTQTKQYLKLKNKKEATYSIIISKILIIITTIISFIAGLAIFSVYKNCDPIKSGIIKKYDEIIPLYINDHLLFIPGIIGLFISVIMIVSLNAISTNLNSLADIIVMEFIKPAYNFAFKTNDYPKSLRFLHSKLCVLIFSIITIIPAFVIRQIESVTQLILTMRSAVATPILTIYTLGMIFPFVNEKGAIAGFVASVALMAWIIIGGPKPPLERLSMSTENCTNENKTNSSFLNSTFVNSTISSLNQNNKNYYFLHKVSYVWYPVIGFIPTFIIGIIVSLITKKCRKRSAEKDADENDDYEDDFDLYIHPLAKYLFRNNQQKRLQKHHRTALMKRNKNGNKKEDGEEVEIRMKMLN
ncbi:putative sodium-dependent multivitamin transporter isoform X4 [Lycorma delicatula]|uniref:putative sodium-dependent multivitamin transporter isoform X4 n=1 Tax=Lycorma delicatula TaxID=130591 RepID=UPI003F50F0A2